MFLNELYENFKHPKSSNRTLSFWAWNDILSVKEIVSQIQNMKDSGVGGFFMHSRDGLETKYMGDVWKNCVIVASDEAARLGMQAWLYDEDRWPSGTAGGIVTSTYGDESRLKGLTIEVCTYNDTSYLSDNSNVLAIYSAKTKNMEIFSLKRLSFGEQLDKDNSLLIVRLEISGKSEWFNDESPPDNLNPVSVRHFIESTHEKYKEFVGEKFGSTIPGIFTDEPSLADRHATFPKNRGWIPWTYGFEKEFLHERGYDFLDVAPYLYFNGLKSGKTRHDYWHTITERFAKSYSLEIQNWCKKNAMLYTGHFLQEDKLGLCTRVNGGIMLHYRYQDIPGIDMLCERTKEYMTVKQCTSVANQYGKIDVLSETYGCTGWEFSFEGQKWIGDWQLVLGVTRLSKHLTLYSLKGCRKRDYPPSFQYHDTQNNYHRVLEDYFGRIMTVLSNGKAIRNLLVLHPMSTAWYRLGADPYGNPIRKNERDIPEINEYGENFNEFLKYLSGIHYDYDLGDELLMKEDASIEENLFRIGLATYRVVIVPPIDTILSSTVKLLLEFLKNDGKVIVINPTPFNIDGEPNNYINKLFTHKNCLKANTFSQVGVLLTSELLRYVSIVDNFGNENINILYLLKDLGTHFSLFIVNNDRENSHDVIVKLCINDFVGYIENWDLVSGNKKYISVKNDDKEISFSLNLKGADSKLFMIEKKAIHNTDVKEIAKTKDTFLMSFSPVCPVKRKIPNALILDLCRYQINKSNESEIMDVWRAQKEIRETLNMRQIHHNGLVQRYKWIDLPHKNDGVFVEFIFEFESKGTFSSVSLVLEDSKHFKILLNNEEINQKSSGFYLDKSFEIIKLPNLQYGKNIIKLSCNYLNAMEIEDCYLIGDFAVSPYRCIEDEAEFLHTGDWTLQGYLHYPGTLVYKYKAFFDEYKNDRIICKINFFKATTVRLLVNENIIDIPWSASSDVDITDYILIGKENLLDIEVVGSLRNLLGPFHVYENKIETVCDDSFRSEDEYYNKGYNVYPYGLYEAPKIYRRSIL